MADEAVTSDRPISHLREDRLGRERFVRELGTTLATLGGTDSTVVALHGPVAARVVGKMKMAHSSGWETTNQSPWRATTGGTRRGKSYQEAEVGA